jgi:ABC-type Zn2+ transport system substrate-binding protein/surface adhesin
MISKYSVPITKLDACEMNNNNNDDDDDDDDDDGDDDDDDDDNNNSNNRVQKRACAHTHTHKIGFYFFLKLNYLKIWLLCDGRNCN